MLIPREVPVSRIAWASKNLINRLRKEQNFGELSAVLETELIDFSLKEPDLKSIVSISVLSFLNFLLISSIFLILLVLDGFMTLLYRSNTKGECKE